MPWWLINPLWQLCLSILCYYINLSSYDAKLKSNMCHLLNCSLSSKFMINILSSRQDQLVGKGLVLAMWLTTKNYALGADTFDEAVAFNNCFSSLCLHIFMLKNSKGLSFNAECLISMWQKSFESFMASLSSWSPCIIQSSPGECESPVSESCCNLSRTLDNFF